MKKVLKVIAILLAVSALVAGCFYAAYKFTPRGGEKSTTTDPTNSSTSESTTEKTTESTTAPTQTTTTKAETDSLETVLSLIARFPSGTAGSSVKGADIALRLVNYAQFSEYNENEVERDLEHFLANLSDKEKKLFYMNLDEINYFALELIKNKNETVINYLSNPEEYRENEYSVEKYEEFFDEISET